MVQIKPIFDPPLKLQNKHPMSPLQSSVYKFQPNSYQNESLPQKHMEFIPKIKNKMFEKDKNNVNIPKESRMNIKTYCIKEDKECEDDKGEQGE